MKELYNIQLALHAPKDKKNDFGKYAYRNCEGVLEALKPHLKEQKCWLLMNDELVLIGDRYYVKATVTLVNEAGETAAATAFAREADKQGGMAESQITGSASSYARKYALCGLFAIDGNKDADETNTRTSENDEQDDELLIAMDDLRRVRSRAELESAHATWAGIYGKNGTKPNKVWRDLRASLEKKYPAKA